MSEPDGGVGVSRNEFSGVICAQLCSTSIRAGSWLLPSVLEK